MKLFSSPGLCSKEELAEVEKFLLDFKKYFNTYIESMFARNVDEVDFPINSGYLESGIKQVKWYIDFVNQKE